MVRMDNGKNGLKHVGFANEPRGDAESLEHSNGCPELFLQLIPLNWYTIKENLKKSIQGAKT